MSSAVEKEMSELKQVNDKRFANKKFFGKDFSGMDLSNADFRSATLIECDFTGSDLSHALFNGANCYGANFTDAILHRTSFENAILARANFAPKKMFGVTITLTCDTFDKMKVSRTALLYWMFIATMMEAPDEEMQNRIVSSMGEDTYKALSKVFREQVIT